MSIAREGLRYYGGAFLLTLVFIVVGWYVVAIPCGVFFLFSLYFFRDPKRSAIYEQNALLSPADGKILSINHTKHELFTTESLRICIFMSIFDVHINRCPYTGTILSKTYRPGKFFPAYREDAVTSNEQLELWIQNDRFSYSVVQIAGILARRIVSWIHVGDILETGQKIGLIQFGSRVDLYLPADFQASVQKGQQVYAGQTILGTMPLKKREADATQKTENNLSNV